MGLDSPRQLIKTLLHRWLSFDRVHPKSDIPSARPRGADRPYVSIARFPILANKEETTTTKEENVAQTVEATRGAAYPPRVEAKATRIDRRLIDLLISWSGAVVAVVLIALGAGAIYGGAFALDNVKDRLEPQNITFPPVSAMSPEEKAEVGQFANQKVDTGREAEAFSRYIGGHLAAVNDGKTYSETSAAAREEGIPEDKAAELQGKADTLFKGETLRAILLNAYGWWTVGQITLWAGIGVVIAGLILAVFVGLGFFHARKTKAAMI
jgi:hypothetical protein